MKSPSAAKRCNPQTMLLHCVPTPRRLAIAVSRLIVLALVAAGQEKGQPVAPILRATGTSVPTLWRWRQKFRRSGFSGLLPETNRCGRKPKSRQS